MGLFALEPCLIVTMNSTEVQATWIIDFLEELLLPPPTYWFKR